MFRTSEKLLWDGLDIPAGSWPEWGSRISQAELAGCGYFPLSRRFSGYVEE